jgi:hypothetical protein
MGTSFHDSHQEKLASRNSLLSQTISRVCTFITESIIHHSSVIFNTIGSLHKGNLVFTVKVFELDECQKSFKSTKVSSVQQELEQSEFTIYAFSSSQND